ncbi:MAG: SGNH/GDSL hydrolase family protein [Vicinamibacterales bacterium]
MKAPRGHIVLLGDSIFDNQSYTAGQPDVVSHLRTLVPPQWEATLCAVDGATTGSVARQFDDIPEDASHLVLSIGGNDALSHLDLLDTRLGSSREALLLYDRRVGAFEEGYRDVMAPLAGRRLPLTVCTIYNGALPAEIATPARMLLMMFNDVIMRAALEHRASVIELRTVCVTPSDYANPIEPSGAGGRKIAAAIARAVGALPGPAASQVYTGWHRVDHA